MRGNQRCQAAASSPLAMTSPSAPSSAPRRATDPWRTAIAYGLRQGTTKPRRQVLRLGVERLQRRLVVDEGVDLARPQRRDHVAEDVVGVAGELHELRASERLRSPQVRAAADGRDAPAGEVGRLAHVLAGAHHHALVEPPVGPRERHDGLALRRHRLARPDGVDPAVAQHVVERRPLRVHPGERQPEPRADGDRDVRLEAAAHAVRVGPVVGRRAQARAEQRQRPRPDESEIVHGPGRAGARPWRRAGPATPAGSRGAAASCSRSGGCARA